MDEYIEREVAMDVREKLVKLLKTSPTRNGYTDLEDVADHLITNGVTVQEWISVKDRLPDDNVQVLACTRNGKPFPAHCECGKWRVSHSVTITHWMPLPPPPKGE